MVGGKVVAGTNVIVAYWQALQESEEILRDGAPYQATEKLFFHANASLNRRQLQKKSS